MPVPVKFVFLEPRGSDLRLAPTPGVKLSFTHAFTPAGEQTKVTAAADSEAALAAWLRAGVPVLGLRVHVFRWMPAIGDYLEVDLFEW